MLAVDRACDVNIVVAYTVVSQGTKTADIEARFVATWLTYPPGVPVRLIACCNGGPLDFEVGSMLALAGAEFYPRANEGADRGGYMDVAKNFPSDMQLCLGESCFFTRPGWMERLIQVWNRHGKGLYGFLASKLLTLHINTTCFCLSPELFSAWAYPVDQRPARYSFEHGADPFWRRVRAAGRPVRLVTFSGDYEPWEWRTTSNAFWQGDQSDCLIHCIHTTRFAEASPENKAKWTRNADRGL